MANLHHRHTDTGKREQVFLGFFQNRHRHDRRAGAEVEDSFSHDVCCALCFALCPLRFALCALRFVLCSLFFVICSDICLLPTAYCLLPTIFRSTAPATRKISERGTRRSVSIMKKFVQPEITE